MPIPDKVLEETPVDGQPVDVGLKEALDGAITSAFVGHREMPFWVTRPVMVSTAMTM